MAEMPPKETKYGSLAIDNLVVMIDAYPAASSEELVGYYNIFGQCYDQVMSLYHGDTKREIDTFVLHHVGIVHPYGLFTSEGITRTKEYIFGKAYISEMMLRLTNLFLARLPDAYRSYMKLALQLSWAHDISGHGDPDSSIVPMDISSRLMSFEDIMSAIAENKWLLVLLLLMKSVRIDVPTTPAPVVPAEPRRG